MITTISLVYIHRFTWLQFFFIANRTFKISLSKFHIYSIVLTIVIMSYVTFPKLADLITGRFGVFLTTFTHFVPTTPTSCLWNYQSVLCS